MRSKILSITVPLILSISLILSGCGSKSQMSETSSKPTVKGTAQNKTMDMATNGINNGEDAKKKSDSFTTQNTSAVNVASSEKIVKTANISMETKNFNDTVEGILKKTSTINGYVENSSVNGISINNNNNYQSRYAKLRVRIPKENFEGFLNDIGNLGNITMKNLTGQNISDQYYDTDAHLKSLKIEEERLLELLKKSGELKDIIELEKELSNVRYQIESLTSSLNRMDNMVNYCTVDIDINEVSQETQIKNQPITLGQKIAVGFTNSIGLLVKIFKGLIIGFVVVLPFLIIGGAIAAFVLYIRRIKNKKN